MKYMILVVLVGLIVLSGCTTNTIIIKKDICREPGNYCHEYIVDGGQTNISFPTVNGSDFNYTVEGL